MRELTLNAMDHVSGAGFLSDVLTAVGDFLGFDGSFGFDGASALDLVNNSVEVDGPIQITMNVTIENNLANPVVTISEDAFAVLNGLNELGVPLEFEGVGDGFAPGSTLFIVPNGSHFQFETPPQ